MATVLVTRPAESGTSLSRLLRERGIGTIEVPTVALDAESTAANVDAMFDGLRGAAWLVVTSAVGARTIAARGRTIPDGVRVAAVGPTTAAALRDNGIRVDHVPAVHRSAAVADGLSPVAGRRVVIARADAATDELPQALRQRGATVDEVVAYRTNEAPAQSRELIHAALAAEPDLVAFTSGSTVRGLLRLAPDPDRARRLPAACIGPVTAAEARAAGFGVAAMASTSTALGLAEAIATYLQPETP